MDKNIFRDVTTVTYHTNYVNSVVRKYVEYKNIGYSLQYLEFLNNCLKKGCHATIESQLCKTFVITSVAIMELICVVILKMKGFYRHGMTFEQVINKVASENIFESIDGVKDTLHNLRDLRNRVHLAEKVSKGESKTRHNHDFNLFGLKQANMAKSMLGRVLTSEFFRPFQVNPVELFDFLIVRKV